MFLSRTEQAASLPQRLIGQRRLQKQKKCSFWEFYTTTNNLCEHNIGVLNDKARGTNNSHCAVAGWYTVQTLRPHQITWQCTAHFKRYIYFCASSIGGNKSRFLSHIMHAYNICWDVLLLSAFVEQLKVGPDVGLQRPVWLYIIKCVCACVCSSHNSEVIELRFCQ
jgi:hypothetical protein